MNDSKLLQESNLPVAATQGAQSRYTSNIRQRPFIVILVLRTIDSKLLQEWNLTAAATGYLWEFILKRRVVCIAINSAMKMLK